MSSAWLPVGLLVLAVAAVALLAPGTLRACDSCNYIFQEQILNERRDTPLGRDILRAMDNQRDLPLPGLTSPVALASLQGSSAPPAAAAESTNGAAEAAAAASAPATAAAPAAAPATTRAARPSPPRNPAVPDTLRRDMAPIFEGQEFIEIIRRDQALPIPPTSFVPQDATPDKSFTITLHEGKTYIGNNVVYDGFLIDGQIPGPTIIVDEGDIVELKVVNDGTVPHGASIHAAYTQTSKYLGNIPPGETQSILFRATVPGVYMYHCAPGGHGIPMHVLFGQYGMMVVRPKSSQYQLEQLLGHGPDVELYLIQHELYASGKDAIEGRPMYVMFNGKTFRYVEEPIQARPGDYVRINFLNIGPNLLSTFHLVGIIWDFAYWQGHPDAMWPGGQSVTAGPTDSWVVEFRMPPEEGAFAMVSHALGSTSRGAIGLLVGDRNAETPVVVKADGPLYTEAELASATNGALRVISPFKPGTPDVDAPVVVGNDTKEATVRIIGNSYYPKVLQVTPGTTVTWVNEDVFSYLAGEVSGVHNAVATNGPERFATPLLAHAESYSFTFTKEGEYDYICTPHPYMKGRIIVAKERGLPPVPLSLAGIALGAIALVGLVLTRRRNGAS
jgi:nitrite reductase (NO-forming)